MHHLPRLQFLKYETEIKRRKLVVTAVAVDGTWIIPCHARLMGVKLTCVANGELGLPSFL